jgi:hypothetical protein
MSRPLPSRPNLEHLRKQAKELLETTRAHEPSWQLADAQFALARGYGFSSWPALKAHVEAARPIDDVPAAPRVAPPAENVNGECPLAGSWVANVAESVRHPAFPFRSATIDARVSGTRITMTQLVVDDSGQTSGGTMTIDADGRPHAPDGGSASHALVAQWLDARTLEAIDTKDGVEMGRGRYEVSPDGQRMIVTTAEQRIVFDRR